MPTSNVNRSQRGYHVAADDLGEQVEIQWRGWAPYLGWRLGVLFLLALLVVIGADMLGPMIVPFLTGATVLDQANAFNAAVILAVIAFVYSGMCLALAHFAGSSFGYWRWFRLHKARGEWAARYSGWLLLGWRTRRIPLSAVERVDLTFGVVQGGSLSGKLQVHIDVRYLTARGSRKTLPLRLPAYNGFRHTQAHALMCRIGKLLDCRNIVEQPGGRLGFQLSVGRDVDSDPGAQPIPEALPAIDLQFDSPGVRFEEPPRPVEPPDLAVLAPLISPTRVDGEFGRRLRVEHPAFQWQDHLGLLGVGGLLGGLFGAVFVGLTYHGIWIGALAGTVAIWAFTRSLQHGREIVIDWDRRTITYRSGKTAREYAFDEVRGLQLSSRYLRGEGSRMAVKRYEFLCMLEIVTADRCLEVGETNNWERDVVTPYRQFLPLAVELARSLDVPYWWRGSFPAGADVAKSQVKWLVAAAVVLAAAGVWYVGSNWMGAGTSHQPSGLQLVNELSTFGADCELQKPTAAGFGPGLGEYWRVHFPNKDATDTMLHSIRQQLAALGRYSLELDECPVTNAALEGLDVTNLVSLVLYQTAVGDAGLAQLTTAENLVVLDVSYTSVGDGGLPHLTACQKLDFLGLAGTQVTDDGLQILERLSGLRTVNLNATQVTPAGVERLRSRMNALQIIE